MDQFENVEHFIYYGIFKYTFLVTLREGEMFGDLGLLLRKPRAATIICREDTEFATLTADDYRKILKNAEIMKMNNQVDFFQKNLLQSCPRDTVVRLSYNFKKQKVYKDTIIYH